MIEKVIVLLSSNFPLKMLLLTRLACGIGAALPNSRSYEPATSDQGMAFANKDVVRVAALAVVLETLLPKSALN